MWAPFIGVLAVIAIIYASLACLAQTDMKRLIAFSSVGHMGFVMLGISTLNEQGINGAIMAMVVHGLITGMLFFLVGSIYDRFHTREIARLGGMALMMPWLAGTPRVLVDRVARSARTRRVLGRVPVAGRRVQPGRRSSSDMTTLYRVLMVASVSSARCSPPGTSCGCCSA